ncbi:hypothetical protein LY76DRAFT_241246 [Colletotrichum caudatum]|nr:hypothetical protein LY76DRAFT_241246 [Colletotrichum caudatum]
MHQTPKLTARNQCQDCIERTQRLCRGCCGGYCMIHNEGSTATFVRLPLLTIVHCGLVNSFRSVTVRSLRPNVVFLGSLTFNRVLEPRSVLETPLGAFCSATTIASAAVFATG